jgi:hypothetical protein
MSEFDSRELTPQLKALPPRVCKTVGLRWQHGVPAACPIGRTSTVSEGTHGQALDVLSCIGADDGQRRAHSQADSASSMLVTRSRVKAQVGDKVRLSEVEVKRPCRERIPARVNLKVPRRTW